MDQKENEIGNVPTGTETQFVWEEVITFVTANNITLPIVEYIPTIDCCLCNNQ